VSGSSGLVTQNTKPDEARKGEGKKRPGREGSGGECEAWIPFFDIS